MFKESLHLLSLSRRRRTKRFRHDVSTEIGALDISKLDITRGNVAFDEEHGVFDVCIRSEIPGHNFSATALADKESVKITIGGGRSKPSPC